MYRAKQLWQCGENVYLAGLNEDGTHHQTKYLRREDYLPLGATVHMEGRAFRVDTVNYDRSSVTLQDVALAEMRMPVFREEPLALVRELYEEQDMMESPLPDYKVGDNVVVELPTRTIEGKVGYVGETDVHIDTSAHGQSWDNEVVNKQRFISQIMTSKSPVRSCEDVDEQALSYAEIKALCAGNPLIKEKMDLDVQVAKLKVLKADHQSQKFRLQDKLLTKFPADIQETNAYIAGVKADAQLAAAHPQEKEGFCGMTIKGVTYDEKKTAGERLVLACSELPNAEEKVIGSYRGFELSLRFDTYRSEYQAILKGQRRYPVALGTDPLGNIIRLDNSLNNFPERINSAENELATLHQQQAAAQIEVEKPFPQEEELAEKSARLAELNAQLDVDEKSHEPEQDEEEQENVSRRPSVLAALEEKSDKPEPVKPFRSYYDKDGDAR